MKKAITAMLCIIALAGCGKTQQDSGIALQNPDIVSSESMTIEEKVGQMLMVRCDSITLTDIKDTKPGGILMFASDFEGLDKDGAKDKISKLKSSVNISPYIAVDEEGGTVVRVSSNPKLAPEKFQSPKYYYETGGMELVNKNTAEKSELLLELGITMNLAPVADISQNSEDFIFERSFGKDAQLTAEFIKETVRVMKDKNIVSCLKHFPGYGGNVDTHTNIAIDLRSISHLRQNDFIPFKSGIDAGCDAVLVSHNIINSIDPTQPASISRPVHDVLRDELGFSGIIITDDMAMAAALNHKTPYKRAVLAGNDMIIVTDFESAYNEILGAVINGEIPESVINTAVDRIITNKRAHGVL